ncbi:RecT family recombinase [Brevibacillus centrosporus]|uniref:RecT family recombinase n=1 Tax=Brevibacillus centrosporus TaxID=54910 RepID=UPI003D23D59F
MSKALALMPFGELTEQDIVTVRETIAKDCNESQFRLFMGIAKSSGANPLLQEIHPSVFQNKLTVQFGIDFHVRKAKETEGYQGYDVQLVHDNDTFKMHQEKAEDGRYYAVIDEHSWGVPRGKVVGGYAIAYKEGYAPFTVVMDVEEVEHFKRSQIGMQKTMWTNYFNDMFKKHMTRRALKAAFGLRFDDVESADAGPAAYEPQQRKDITAEVEQMATEPKTQEAPVEDDETSKLKKARDEMKKKFALLGITDSDAMGAYIAEHCKTKGEKPTLVEITGLLKIMDMHIAEKQAQTSNDDELN